jgi:hypothetical protein
VSSVAAAVEIEVCARNTFSRLAQGGKMGADGRSCAFFHGDRYLAGRLVARHDRHREELVLRCEPDAKWAARPVQNSRALTDEVERRGGRVVRVEKICDQGIRTASASHRRPF